MMEQNGGNHTVEIPEPSLVIQALKILTTARQSSGSNESKTVTNLNDVLLANVNILESKLQSESPFQILQLRWESDTNVVIPSDCSPKWRFVSSCLKILYLLQASIKESLEAYGKRTTSDVNSSRAPKMSPDTLSFEEKKVVLGAVQFVVSLGVCPNLHNGIGIPLELRSGFSAFVKATEEGAEISESVKIFQLFSCVRVLLSCVSCPTLGTLILTNHLVDLLAALFQLTYIDKQQRRVSRCAKSNVNDVVTDSNSNKQSEENSLQNMSPASMVDLVMSKFNEVEATDSKSISKQNEDSVTIADAGKELEGDNGIDFVFCERNLEDLLQKIYPPLLVRTLLLLQGGPKSKKPCQNAPLLQQAPKWLRDECGQRLTNILMTSKGVQSVLRGMLDAPGTGKGMTEADDWRKCDAVAKVIACCPLQTLSVEEYYKSICPQLIELLHIQDKQVCRQFLRVACSTISIMDTQQPGLMQKYLFEPILKPLLTCTRTDIGDAMATKGHVIISEAAIAQCLEDCNKVFVVGAAGNPSLVCFLQPVIHVLYNMFVFVKPGVSVLKSTCQDLLATYLKNVDTHMALTFIQMVAFEEMTSQNEAQFPMMHQHMKFENGANGGIVVCFRQNESTEESTQETNIECIVALLKELEGTSVPGEFLVFMLKELTLFILTEVEGETSDDQKQASGRPDNDQALLDIEQRYQSKVEQFYRKLALLNILAAVCESLGPECIKSARHTLEFVKATLERGVQICKRTDDMTFEAFENETLTMAMGLLTAVLTGAFELTDKDKDSMQELLPLLQEISSDHPESSVQEMATDIRIAIATHGAVWSEISKSKSKGFDEISKKFTKENNKVKEVQSIRKTKIEVLAEDTGTEDATQTVEDGSDQSTKIGSAIDKPIVPVTIATQSINERNIGDDLKKDLSESFDRNVKIESKNDENKKGKSKNGESKKDGLEENSELDQAFKELCDTLIPVRGHGLIRLTHLVQRRDPEVQKRHLAVLKIFEENLDHSDSYLYLSAVNGLAAMCDMYPSLVVPMVCKQFAEFYSGDGAASQKKRSPELRMKLGEVMLKASRCLGSTIPQYRDMLISSVLTGARDDEILVRASSLSNLGEICKLLKFSLGNITHEVFECCSSMLKHDKDVVVRKAAAQAIVLLLQGTDSQTIQILDSVLKDLYRLLKHVMQAEKEEGVKLHVHLALNELDDLMKDYLFPKQKLEKRIRVLDVD